MELLLNHISYLLGEHRSVSVLGLGTFTRIFSDAIQETSGIKAPIASVSFSEEVDSQAPRVLEASVARALQLSIEEVSTLIDDKVADIRKYLCGGHTVDIEGVGSLTSDERGICFTPAANPKWSTATWYKSLDAIPLQTEVTPVVSEPEPAVKEAFMRSLNRTASSAAAIAILILIAFVTSQLPGRRHAAEPTYATFGVESTAVAPTDPLIPRPGAISQALVLVVNTPSDGVVDATKPQRTLETDDPYILVIASLANQHEVDKYMAQHTGENLGLLSVDGRFRVFAATGATIGMLQSQATADGLYERYPNAWICRR